MKTIQTEQLEGKELLDTLQQGTNIYLRENYVQTSDDHGIVNEGKPPHIWLDFFQTNLSTRARRSPDLSAHYTAELAGNRYRCCLANSYKGWGINMRKLPNKIPTFRDDLHLDWQVIEPLTRGSGLTLFAGRMGSGKSTTMTAAIGKLLETEASVGTVEDPIEALYDKQSVIQREIGTHVKSFPEAIRDCVRQQRNVIVISEIRDADTANAALMAASTGHSVFATIHADNIFDIYIRMLALVDHRYERLLARSLRGLWWQQVVRFGTKERRPLPVYESLLVDVEARQVLEKGPDALPMLANAMDRQKRQNMSQVAMDYVRMNKANREEMSEFLTRRNMINSM